MKKPDRHREEFEQIQSLWEESDRSLKDQTPSTDVSSDIYRTPKKFANHVPRRRRNRRSSD